MRHWFATGCLFTLLYTICLLASAPARLLTLFSPAQLQWIGVSGTLWQGEAEQLRVGKRLLGKLNWQWGWRSGLPVWQLRLQGGEIGQGRVTVGWMGDWQLSEGRWQLPVETLPTLLGYPLPLEGRGELALELDNARFDGQQCLALTAKVEWRSAQFNLLGQSLPLGEPQLKLRCEPQRLLFALHPPQAPLKLFGEGSVDRRGAYRFSGGLAAMEAVPAQWRQVVEAATRPGAEGKRTIEGAGIWPINLY
jgi:general secretion pathway protein N